MKLALQIVVITLAIVAELIIAVGAAILGVAMLAAWLI